MTAVASPPSVQSLPRWDAAGHGADSLDAMTSEELSRMLLPQKSAPRPQSSSSTQSSSDPASQLASRNSAFMASDLSRHHVNGDVPVVNGDDGAWGPRKKAAKFWPNSNKSDGALSLPSARNPPLPHSSENLASSSMPPSLPNSSLASSQQPMQATTVRTDPTSNQQAMLALQSIQAEGETPLFDRKQIVIPFFPDVQKIGRQTNQKTVPAPSNGYFDSKVLSRQHAEVWAERNGKIWIRDVKSSNGTFVNGVRLSQENKESEPHELREGDKLELGIDIVAEDQKSVVHHKVSAKVELAGLYNTASNMLDMMHLDPNTGQPILVDHANPQVSQLRARGGSQGSLGGNNRVLGPGALANGANIMGPQRQVNMWMAPITVEQVVKKLLTELKHAKLQERDLQRTDEFFTTILNLAPGEEPPKSPPKVSLERKPTASPSVPSDHLPSFYQAPAPPPSHPLPEKPDGPSSGVPNSLLESGLKRSDTEKPLFTSFSPSKTAPQDSQILSLLEALKSAKQELSSQGDRMKYLETALLQERQARESAERKARALSGNDGLDSGQDQDETIRELEPPLDSLEMIEQDLPNGHLYNASIGPNTSQHAPVPSTEALKNSIESSNRVSEAPTVQTRYELLKQEFDQMKQTMETYKRRAEEAETSQRRFADLIESFRSGNSDAVITNTSSGPGSVGSLDSTIIGSDTTSEDTAVSSTSPGSTMNHHADKAGFLDSLSKHAQATSTGLMNGNAVATGPGSSKSTGNGGTFTSPAELEKSLMRHLRATASAAIEIGDAGRPSGEKDGRWNQSAPYVSMVGVVLLGFGIMTWLNGWQPPVGGGGGKVVE